jgi:uncharacterized protein YjbJ (UPF0337 family)
MTDKNVDEAKGRVKEAAGQVGNGELAVNHERLQRTKKPFRTA